MNQRSIIVAVVVVAIVAVAAYLIFGQGGQPATPVPTATPPGATATPAATSAVGDATPTGAPSGNATPTGAATGSEPTGLSVALLALEDLPANWLARTEEPPADTAPITFLCENITRRGAEVVRSAFHRREDIGPIVRSTVARYADGGAEAFMADLQAAVDNCTAWQVESGGRQVNWEATPVDIEPLGDQVIAVRAKTVGQISFGQVMNGFVYVRVGNLIGSVSTTAVNADVFGLGGLPSDDLEQFGRLVAERLQAMAAAE